MPRVVLDDKAVAQRGAQIPDLLRPIRGEIGGPAWQRLSGQGGIIYATRDATIEADYAGWRFATFLPDFYAAYHELWMPLDSKKQKQWCLNKAYLNIYRVDRLLRTQVEYICLHCDPEDADSDDHKACYKQSPHIHVKAANDPIPKAHIALSHGFIDAVLKSHDDLFHAMYLGMELIRDEILLRTQK
jgi:hypothetical protein